MGCNGSLTVAARTATASFIHITVSGALCTCHDQDAFCVLKSHLASSEVKDEIDQDALHGEEPAQHSGGVPQVTKLHVDLIEKLAKGASRLDLANDVKAWHHW